MITDQNFYDICYMFFYPTASATVYGRRPKFFMAEHSATAEGENCAYGPTLQSTQSQSRGADFTQHIITLSQTPHPTRIFRPSYGPGLGAVSWFQVRKEDLLLQVKPRIKRLKKNLHSGRKGGKPKIV